MTNRTKKTDALDLEAPLSTTAPCRFITAYGPKRRVRYDDSSPSRTKQSFAAECDINNIMARYLNTGLITHENTRQALYGDATGVDYQSAQNFIAAANSEFQALPSAIRSRFDNDPALFLDFIHDEKNLPEMAELGFLKDESAKKWIDLKNQAVTPEKPAEKPAEPASGGQ